MAKVILPATLRNLTGGADEIEIDGATAGDVLRQLEELHPPIRGWVLDERSSLRRHVNVFVNHRRAGLGTPTGARDELHVIQSISGGAAVDEDLELLVGTKKGLFALRGDRNGPVELCRRQFPGQSVEYAVRDPRSGRYFAAVTHGQYGPRLYYADSPEGDWKQAEGPVFPEDVDAAVKRVWIVEPGEADGVLWAGVDPAALFQSTDGGESWSLNRGLWNVPGRDEWEGGLGGQCLHSICPWPGDPSRLAVAISAAGVWITEDGGETWRRGGRGLIPRYLPEEARHDAVALCVHDMQRAPLEPATLYLQFHGGVYRSDDGGDAWTEISSGDRLPADFGFPIVLDPRDPASAYVIPLHSDEDRVAVDGKLRVFETRDRGASWRALGAGLPQHEAYLTVLRQAFCHDGRSPLGLFFGAESGEVFGSFDAGATWKTLVSHLPPVFSVRHT